MEPNLVQRAHAGDERAFEALTVTSHPSLFRVAFGVLRDVELAEDATQRAFLEIWRWLPRLSETDAFEGWAMGHLLRTCRMLEVDQAENEDEQGATSDSSGAESLGAFIDGDQLSRGFRQLDFDDRAVLVLRFLGELGDDVVGLALGLKSGAVEARTNAALDSLDTFLDGDSASSPELTPQVEGA